MNQVELLKHEADFLATEDVLLDLVHGGDGLRRRLRWFPRWAGRGHPAGRATCSCPIRMVRRRTNTPRVGPRTKRREAPRFASRRCETTCARRKRGYTRVAAAAAAADDAGELISGGFIADGVHRGHAGSAPGRVQTGQRRDHDGRENAFGHQRRGQIQLKLKSGEQIIKKRDSTESEDAGHQAG